MNSSFPNRWSFSYLNFTKYVTNIIAEPKYKYGQQEQVTVRNHNRQSPFLSSYDGCEGLTIPLSKHYDPVPSTYISSSSDLVVNCIPICFSVSCVLNITFNPHLPNGLSHPYQLDESIFYLRSVWCTFWLAAKAASHISWNSPSVL